MIGHLRAIQEHTGQPTAAQLRTGNYRKRRLVFQGMTVAIETEAGTLRRGRDANGHQWEKLIPFAYGYLHGTLGTDGDHVDVFIGPNAEAPMAYVVQAMVRGSWDQPDEDKVMLGFDSEDDARRAFLLSYDDERYLGAITPMPVAEFKAKLRTHRGKLIKALFFRR